MVPHARLILATKFSTCSELFLPPLPNSIPDQNDPNSYLYWSVCIAGPVMILAAATHAILWQPFSSIVGAVVSTNE